MEYKAGQKVYALLPATMFGIEIKNGMQLVEAKFISKDYNGIQIKINLFSDIVGETILVLNEQAVSVDSEHLINTMKSNLNLTTAVTSIQEVKEAHN